MRLLLALILLLPFGLNAATVFTEFYCDSTVGTNINSGSTTNAAATYTSVNGNFNGTDTFTPTDGSTPASTVSAGDWAAIYIDGATNLVQSGSGGYIVRVLSVAAGANGAITVSTTAFAGTAPSSSATGRSIKVGGAWNGPYGSIGFPFGFLATTATNAPNVFPRCNFKNTAQYNVTAAMTQGNAGPMRFQGMTTAPGDFGMAVIDGGTSTSGYALFSQSGNNIDFADLKFSHNGSSGTGSGFVNTGTENTILRCVFSDMRQHGFTTSQQIVLIECEAYGNNVNNSANVAGFNSSASGTVFIRCITHDNTTANAHGFSGNAHSIFIGCIADSNGANGFNNVGVISWQLVGCESYNNSSNGIYMSGASSAQFYAENCSLIKNSLYGITSPGSLLRNGSMVNCGFGTGTMTNASGNIDSNLGGIVQSGTVLYSADQTPWTDPGNGNFRINLTAAKGAGRGSFLQSQVNSPTNTLAFPDIGAAQSASTNAAASGGGSYTFAQ